MKSNKYDSWTKVVSFITTDQVVPALQRLNVFSYREYTGKWGRLMKQRDQRSMSPFRRSIDCGHSEWRTSGCNEEQESFNGGAQKTKSQSGGNEAGSWAKTKPELR